MSPPIIPAILLGCVATFEDIRHRSIANWINLSGLAAGLVCHTASRGLAG